MEHECKHEADLAGMAHTIQDVCKDVSEIKSDIKDLRKALLGNGRIGITTQQELNKQAIKRLYWMIGVICVPVLILALSKFLA